MKKIILISGKAEHGKTTVANMLKEHLLSKAKIYNKEIKVTNMSYATTIKDYAKRYFGWDGSNETKPRELLQKLGTDVIRKKLGKPLFHAQRLAEDIEVLWDEFDYVIVDDCRFPNEYYYLKAKFPREVIFINVNRPSHISSLTNEQLGHESETALNGFDEYNYRLRNEDLKDLYNKTGKIIMEDFE